jgi:hypothetical protein
MRILKVAQERRGQHEHIFLNCDIWQSYTIPNPCHKKMSWKP